MRQCNPTWGIDVEAKRHTVAMWGKKCNKPVGKGKMERARAD